MKKNKKGMLGNIIAGVIVFLLIGLVVFGMTRNIKEQNAQQDYCQENDMTFRRKSCGFGCSTESQCYNKTGVYEILKSNGGEYILIPK